MVTIDVPITQHQGMRGSCRDRDGHADISSTTRVSAPRKDRCVSPTDYEYMMTQRARRVFVAQEVAKRMLERAKGRRRARSRGRSSTRVDGGWRARAAGLLHEQGRRFT